jgi:hypothetical protein
LARLFIDAHHGIRHEALDAVRDLL